MPSRRPSVDGTLAGGDLIQSSTYVERSMAELTYTTVNMRSHQDHRGRLSSSHGDVLDVATTGDERGAGKNYYSKGSSNKART